MVKPYIFYAKLLLHWGFAIRYPELTAAQPALVLPPETTIIGAFYKALLTYLEINPYIANQDSITRNEVITPLFDYALDSTLSASAALLNEEDSNIAIGLILYKELTRIIGAPYKRGGDIAKKVKIPINNVKFYEGTVPTVLLVQAIGSSYGPGSVLAIQWTVDMEKLSQYLKIPFEELAMVGKKAVNGITWIGSKEGLVTLIEADAAEAEPVDHIVKTPFYIPIECVDKVLDAE